MIRGSRYFWWLLLLQLRFFCNGESDELQHKLRGFLTQLQQELRYEIVVSIQNATELAENMQKVEEGKEEHCIWPDFVRQLNATILQIAVNDGDEWGHDYKWRFGRNMLSLHCRSLIEVKALGDLLHVVYVQQLRTQENDKEKLQSAQAAWHCQHAFNVSHFKVLLIPGDFANTQRYFQCRLYPLGAAQPYRRMQFMSSDSSAIYDATQFRNMHGATIWTHPEQLAPRSMLERNDSLAMDMHGYVASALIAYALRHNATLRFRFPINFRHITPTEDIFKGTLNGSLDIGATIMVSNLCDSLDAITYPYDVLSYCVMIPLPSTIPIKLVPLYIVSIPVLLIIMLYMFLYGCLLIYIIASSFRRVRCFHFMIFFEMVRAMLAQSYAMLPQPSARLKFVYFQISFICYVVANMYQAFLQSFLTHPPLLPAVSDLNAAYEQGLRIPFPASEMRLLEHVAPEDMSDFYKIAQLIEDYTEYDRLRNSMDNRYIFVVSDRRWQVFAEQQKFFRRRIFFYSQSMCVHSIMPMSFPLRPDLPYRELFEEFLLRIQAIGLKDRWSSWDLYNMIRFGFMTKEDLSRVFFEETGEAITVLDLYWIWLGYCYLNGVALFAFLSEIVWKAWGARWRKVFIRKRTKFCWKKIAKIFCPVRKRS